MKNTLLATVSASILVTTASAQTTSEMSSMKTSSAMKACYDFKVTGGTPLNTQINNGSNFTFSGILTNGVTNPGGGSAPDINPFSISSQVFSSSGSTTATLSSGVVTFSGNVGFIDSLASASGLDDGCVVADFSYNKCTVVNEGSTLFAQMKEREKNVFYGNLGNKEKSVVFFEAFKQNEKGEYYYDSSNHTINKEERLLPTLWYFDEKSKSAKAFETSAIQTGTSTILKDFTVCIECVPEPSSTLLLGLAGLAGLARRKR